MLNIGFIYFIFWEIINKFVLKLQKYRYVVWASFPIGILLILSGAVFYMDFVVPTALKLIYATLYRPLFQLMVAIFIMACVFKIEC